MSFISAGHAQMAAASGRRPGHVRTGHADAKSAYASQTTALKNSLSGLETTIKSAHGQPPLTAAAAVASSVTRVKNSASALQSAVSGKCQ